MKVDEYGKYVRILSYSLYRKVDAKTFIETARSVCAPNTVQFFDAGSIAGEEHLFFATLNALKSFSQGLNIAQTLDVEILLYVSSQRQIGEAIRMVGLNPQTSAIAVVLVGDDEKDVESVVKVLEPLIPGNPDQSILNSADEGKLARLMEIYDVDETELKTLSSTYSGREALSWLLVERAALLAARR